MITANRVKDNITGVCNGKAYITTYSDEKYSKMLELIGKLPQVTTIEGFNALVTEFNVLTANDYSETIEHMTPYLHINKATGQFFLYKDGVLGKHAIPGAFVQRIVKAVETKNDVTPVIKGLVRFMRNPNYSHEKCLRFANYLNTTYVDPELKKQLITAGATEAYAKEQATMFQTSLTQEGLLNSYKVSNELTEKFVVDNKEEGTIKLVERRDWTVDENSGLKSYIDPEYVEDRVFQPAVMRNGGDAFFCGDKLGHIIKVGHVHMLESWELVDCNDHASCVPGLHIGNLDYIRGYQNDGTVTHNIFVDPMDIGAITDDGSGALRVRRYFVHSTFKAVNRGYYNSSSYAAITDADYAKMVKEGIDKANQESAAAVKAANDKIMQINLLKTF